MNNKEYLEFLQNNNLDSSKEHYYLFKIYKELIKIENIDKDDYKAIKQYLYDKYNIFDNEEYIETFKNELE